MTQSTNLYQKIAGVVAGFLFRVCLGIGNVTIAARFSCRARRKNAVILNVLQDSLTKSGAKAAGFRRVDGLQTRSGVFK